MITKTVTSGQRSATATISEETRFVFSDKWNFFHVQNLGTGTVYIGMSAGVTAGNDGVIAIPSGGSACTMHNFAADSVYILSTASDLVQVVGSNSAFPPFKLGGSGGGVTIDSALSDSSTNPVQNKIVTAALNGKAAADHTQAANKGGTGQTSYTVGDILYADTATTLAKLTAGVADTVLTSNGAGTAPSWETPSGGGGVTETLLFDGATNTTDVYTFSAAYTGFKFLIIGAIYNADELFNSIINCANIRPSADYSKKNSFYIKGDRLISINTNGVNFKMPSVSFSYCKIYGVN